MALALVHNSCCPPIQCLLPTCSQRRQARCSTYAASALSFLFGGLQSGYRKQVRLRTLSKMQAEHSKWLGANGSKLAGQCWHARIMQEQPNLLGADWQRRR
jgi:hypothetical protein